uniref:murein L,D-transpeptidase catalytic domain family protein n=1 Tax=Flavobacterium sp. TaxID=239 RepID=UPI004049995B
MHYKLLFLIGLSFISFGFINHTGDDVVIKNQISTKFTAANNITNVKTVSQLFFESLDANNFSLPRLESFTKAFEGYIQLKEQGIIVKNYLTIVDFSLSSTEERLWVVDMLNKKVVLQSLVAHGRNSGDEFASKFSNKAESYQSSLGFYATGEVYQGKHGLSLRLDGLEYGINDNARERAVVIHGADYVSDKFAKSNGRLGRSLGCPAVPYEIHEEFINTIKDKSCLFIYHPSRVYVSKSKLVS